MQNHDRMFLSKFCRFVFIFVPEQVKRMTCEGDVCRLGRFVLEVLLVGFKALEFSVCNT